ncbi:MAG: CotH kinase family protein [Saprospiraceae bacterium]|nr:CotH kinase family protein [Saprospiraceae bacterium]
MILSDSKKRIRLPAWLWLIPVALGLVYMFYPLLQTDSANSDTPDRVFCDAETVRDSLFVNGNHSFGNGLLQSDLWAFSGSYSCRVDAGDGLQFGFGYTLQHPERGALYHAEVWRFNPSKILNYLTIQEEGTGGLYLIEKESVERRADGWERVEIYFRTSTSETDNNYKIYVYTNGNAPVFYDDLLVEKVILEEGVQTEIPTLYLKIGEEGMRKLEEKRKAALQAGILVTGEDDWVTAKMHDGDSNSEQSVELRLKGDWLDHLRGNKWSFRIAMKTGGSWRGMTTFSVHNPGARSFLSEWLLHKFWEKEDVLTTRYDFTEVFLNGKSLGIYAYEEHFEKQLVESKSRREGPILHFSEEIFWSNIERQIRENGAVSYNFQPDIASYESAPVIPFNEKEIRKDSVRYRQFIQAGTLVNQYRNGGKKASDVFDLERAAKYYAITDVLGAYHGIVWHNQRYYFNPIENRLEPIGYDGFSDTPYKRHSFLGQGLSHPGKLQTGPVFASLFQDADFVESYVRYLEEYSSPEFLNSFLKSLQPEILMRQLALNEEFPEYRLDIPEILANARYMRILLYPHDEYSLVLSRNNSGAVSAINFHELPVQIIGYSRKDKGPLEQLDSPILLPAASPREYLGRLKVDSTRFSGWDEIRRMIGTSRIHHYQRVPLLVDIPENASRVYFQVLGLEEVYSSLVQPDGDWLPKMPSQELFPEGAAPSGAGFVVEGQELFFPAGKTTQTRSNILIPAGYRVYFEPGAKLDLIGGASFISRSPVFMVGTEENPVEVFSSDDSAGGFTVMETDLQSQLMRVRFQGLNTLAYKGWNLTGAVTFYEADVQMEFVSFIGNHCEDGLNIVRSDIDIQKILVNNTPFDGFDCDFCRGLIQNSVFSNTGNDGLDFSGSILEVRGCQIINNGDKGVSVGEASEVAVFQSEVQNANIGLASKDRSVLVVDELKLKDCNQGFTAYQKKPEFGGASILVRRYEATNIKRLYLVLDGSRIEFSDPD